MSASVVVLLGDRLYFRTKQRETPAGRRLRFYDFTLHLTVSSAQQKSPALLHAGDTSSFLLFFALQKRSSRLDLSLLHIARALFVAAELVGELAETAA